MLTLSLGFLVVGLLLGDVTAQSKTSSVNTSDNSATSSNTTSKSSADSSSISRQPASTSSTTSTTTPTPTPFTLPTTTTPTPTTTTTTSTTSTTSPIPVSCTPPASQDQAANCTCSGEINQCIITGSLNKPELKNCSGSNTSLSLQGNEICYIKDNAFIPGLISLDLRNNPVHNVSSHAFKSISETLQSIMFSNASFTSLPIALEHLDNLKTFYIDDSTIQNYPYEVMAQLARSVNNLTLKSVGLKQWPSWLQWFMFLESLDLSDNDICSLPEKALDTFTLELKHLNLSNTGIDSQNTSVLQSLKVLQSLDMSSNKITDYALLTYNLIPSSGTLTAIDVSNNNLTQLPRLSVFTQLTRASFRNASISEVTSAAFPINLIHLDLGDNLFKDIPDSVKNLAKLQTLSMRGNLIEILSPDDFPFRCSIRELNLQDNPITVIEEHTFDNVKQLTSLDLAGTQLTHLPLALSKLENLSYLNMKFIKKLVCTCNELPVAEWIVKKAENITVEGKCMLVGIDEYADFMVRQCPGPLFEDEQDVWMDIFMAADR